MNKKKNLNEKQSIDSIDNIKFFYGIPHCHTSFSTGKGSPLEALNYAKNNSIDFIFLTDHNNYLNQITNKEKNLSKWKISKNIVEKFNTKNKNFLAVVGFESNSSPWGHLNIINSNSFFTGGIKNIDSLVLWLLTQEDTLLLINHPNNLILNLSSVSLCNKFFNSMEVANGCFPNKYSRFYKTYFSMLDRGFKLSAINGQDNHRVNFGDSENLTVALAYKLSEKSILNAFRTGKTYSSESKTLKFYFTINSCFMGDTLLVSEGENLNFLIYAQDSIYTINKISVYSNGGKILKEIKNLNLFKITYLISLPYILENTWYVIKLNLSNKREALSSPIYVYEK